MPDPIHAIEAFLEELDDTSGMRRNDIAEAIYDEFPPEITDEKVAEIFTDLARRVRRGIEASRPGSE